MYLLHSVYEENEAILAAAVSKPVVSAVLANRQN